MEEQTKELKLTDKQIELVEENDLITLKKLISTYTQHLETFEDVFKNKEIRNIEASLALSEKILTYITKLAELKRNLQIYQIQKTTKKNS